MSKHIQGVQKFVVVSNSCLLWAACQGFGGSVSTARKHYPWNIQLVCGNIEAHTKKKRYKYLIAQRDGDFPRHMPQDRERRDFDSLLKQSNCDTARLAAQPDIGVKVIPFPTFFQCCLNQMIIGGLLVHWHYTIDLDETFGGHRRRYYLLPRDMLLRKPFNPNSMLC
jgi:hypothetical protein